MSDTPSLSEDRSLVWRQPFYSGWVNVLFAAAAMTATLPGRTHGLGLITEPLLADLQISRALFAQINLASTLLGASLCIPIGGWIDRYGVRAVGTGVMLALAGCVWAMAGVQSAATLFAMLFFVRGLGQSALSVTSIAMVSKWFRRRQGAAMGVFAVLLTIGFIVTILSVGQAVALGGWRSAWGGVAIAIGCLAPLTWCCVRNGPTRDLDSLHEVDQQLTDQQALTDPAPSLSFGAALRTPAFWVFALGTGAFNFVWSAVTLFNEAILAERGFDAKTSVAVLSVLTGTGLLANLIGGALANRERLGKLLGAGLAVLAVGLGVFPWISNMWQLHVYAISIGLSGGVVTVIFFSAWSQIFGAANVGKILGAAQLLTILASALGPVCAAAIQERYETFAPLFYATAIVSVILAAVAFVVALPDPNYLADQGS